MGIVLWIRQHTANLSGRLLITYVTLMIVGLGGVIVWTGQQITAQHVQQAEHQLELQAHIIANALREPFDHPRTDASSGGRSLQDLIGSYASNIDGRVTLVDANLNVVATSDPAVPTHREDDRPEFIAARAGGEHFDIRWDEWTKEERLFVAAPVAGGEHGAPAGFIQLSVPMLPIYTQMSETWLMLGGVGCIVLLLTVLASTLLARQIAIPVQHLTVTSEQIAAGRLDERVAPAGPSEIRRLGQAFNRMAERVQEMIAAQREFVDNAAHELRSPLTGLRLRIEMLQTHGANDPELTRHYLDQMQHEVGYLQRLVDHLLALAAVEEGQPAEQVDLDLAPLLHELADEIGPLAQQAGVDLGVQLPDHLPCVEANGDQMRIVVRNLLDNAIKYTRTGGTVTLAARTQANDVEIEVADTGIGIPSEALPRVFDRFYRTDRARSRKQGGAGLGLALVRGIVDEHNGKIDVESREGQGSTFTVTLPVKQ